VATFIGWGWLGYPFDSMDRFVIIVYHKDLS